MPTENVADRAGEQSADQDADQGVAAERSGELRRHRANLVRVAQEGRDHRAVDDEIVAVEDQSQSGETDHPQHGAAAFGLHLAVHCWRHRAFLPVDGADRAGFGRADGAGRARGDGLAFC